MINLLNLFKRLIAFFKRLLSILFRPMVKVLSSIRIISPTGDVVSNVIIVAYDLVNAKGHLSDINVTYLIAGGTPKSAKGIITHPQHEGTTKLVSSPSGTRHTFVWDWQKDIAVSSVKDVVLQMRATSIDGTGPAVLSVSFAITASVVVTPNKLPQIKILMPTGILLQGENVEVNYTIHDDESDLVHIETGYSVDGGVSFQVATEAIHPASDGTSNLASSPAGLAHRFMWKAIQDLTSLPAKDIVFRIQAFDAQKGGSDTTVPFTIGSAPSNHPPQVRILSPQPNSTQGSAVEIVYELKDDESDLIRIEVLYSTDNGLTFHPTTEASGLGSEGISGLASDPLGKIHTYFWNSIDDLTSLPVSNIIVQIQAFDNAPGGIASIGSFTVNVNHPPSVQIFSPAANTQQATPVEIQYVLTDQENDVCSIVPFYSIDNGITFLPATSHNSGDGTTGLNSTSQGVIKKFMWNAVQDLASPTQKGVIFKIQAKDMNFGGTSISSIFDVAMPIAPTVRILQPTGGVWGTPVPIVYTLSHPGGNQLLPVEIAFSTDSGQSYSLATEAQNFNSEGIVDLMADINDVNHFFAWDAEKDIPGLNSQVKDNVVVRVRAIKNNEVGEAFSDPLTIDNGFIGVPHVVIPSSGVINRPIIENVFDPPNHQGIHVVARFLLKHAENIRSNVRVQFSVNGQTYRNATPAPSSDQLTNLPAPKISADYRFVWNAANDLGKLNLQAGQVQLKITPYIGPYDGVPFETKVFTVTLKNPESIKFPIPKVSLNTLKILKIYGDNQEIISGQVGREALRVEVYDSANKPVQGARVTFSVATGSLVDVEFEDDGYLRTTTDYYGRAGIRVRPKVGMEGNATILVRIVGMPAAAANEKFTITSRLPKILAENTNPKGPFEYGQTYSLYFRYDTGTDLNDVDFYSDELSPIEFKVTTANAEASTNKVRLPGISSYLGNNFFRVDVTPSVPGPDPSSGGTVTKEQCTFKIEALDGLGTKYETVFDIETNSNVSRVTNVLVLNNGYGPPQDVDEQLRIRMEVVSGYDPKDPAKKIPQRIFPGLTLKTPFKLKIIDEADIYLRSLKDGSRKTTASGNCASTISADPIKIRWYAQNGVIATTLAKGTKNSLEADINDDIFFTPTGDGPWTLEASFNGYLLNPKAGEIKYFIKSNTGSGGGSTITSQAYCTIQPGLFVSLNKTFFIHGPDAVGFEDIAKATATNPGSYVTQVKPGMKVRVLIKDLSPFQGQAEEVKLATIMKDGSDVPAYSGTTLKFKQSVPLNSYQFNQTENLRSDEILIIQNENKVSSGIPMAVIPMARIKAEINNFIFTVKTAGLRRQRVRFGTDSLNGDTEFAYESPVGTSPSGGALNSVTLHNGEFMYSGCDLKFPSSGGDISISRTYRSQVQSLQDPMNAYEMAEPLGPGWFFGPIRYLEVSHRYLCFWDGRGAYYDYPYDYPGKGQFLYITRNTAITQTQSAFEVMDRQRNVFHFNTDGTLRFLKDPSGNKYEYEYNEMAQLVKIKDCLQPGTRAFTIKYFEDTDDNKKNQIANKIEEITDFGNRKISYEYYKTPSPGQQQNGGPGLLKKVTFAECSTLFEGNSIPDDKHRSFELYEYEPDVQLGWRLTNVQTLNTKNTIRKLLTNHFSGGRVVKQEHSSGEFTISPISLNVIEYKNKSDSVTKLSFPLSPFWDGTAPEEVIDPLGFITKMKHNQDGHVTMLQPPTGGKTEYVYDEDSPFARSRADRLAEIQISAIGEKRISRYTYDSRFHRILTSVGPEGNLPEVDPELHIFVFNYDHQRNRGDAGNVVDSFGPRTLNMVSKPVANGRRQPTWIEENPKNEYVYNSFGLITSHVDTMGIKTLYYYYPESNPASGVPQPDAGGFLAEVRYDTEVNPKRDLHLPGTDAGPRLRSTKYKYDLLGYLVETEAEDGLITTITPNQLGEPVKQETGSNANGLQLVSENYLGPNGEVIASRSVRPAAGGADTQTIEKKYAYKNDGLPESTTTKINTNKEVIQTFKFDKGDRLEESFNDLTGVQSSHTYDSRGLEIETLIKMGVKNFVTKREFNYSGVLTQITHPSGDKTTYGVNHFDEIVTAQHPTGITSETILNESGIPVIGVHRNTAGSAIATTEVVLDEYLRPRLRNDLIFRGDGTSGTAIGKPIGKLPNNLGVTTPMKYLPDVSKTLPDTGFGPDDGRATMHAVYDIAGNPVRVTDDRLLQKFFRTDGLGHMVETEDQGGNRTNITCNDVTRETETTYEANSNDPSYPDKSVFKIKTKLDEAGQLVQVTNDLGHTYRCAYDKAGKLLQITDAMGPLTSETYDGLPGSAVLNGPGNAIIFKHDAFGRIHESELSVTVIDPVSGSDRTSEFNEYNKSNKLNCRETYDDLGRLTEKTDSLGNKYTFNYESNLLKEVLFPALPGGKIPKITYSYDNIGRLETITDAKSKVHRKHFVNSRLDKITVDGAAEGLQIHYDSIGNIAALGDLSDPDKKTNFVYDSFGNTLEETIEFKQNSQVQKITIKNEFDGTGRITRRMHPGGYTVEYIRDEKTGLLSEMKNSGGEMAKFYYMGDALLKRKYVKGVSTLFNYSDKGQLEERRITGLVNGDIVTVVKYDRLQRVIEEEETFNGEVTRKEFTYDSAGRLVEEKKTLPPGKAPAPLVSKYFYDGDCILLKEIRDEMDAISGMMVTRTIIRERDGQGRIIRMTESVQGSGPVITP